MNKRQKEINLREVKVFLAVVENQAGWVKQILTRGGPWEWDKLVKLGAVCLEARGAAQLREREREDPGVTANS